MTLKTYKILRAAWFAICVVLIGGGLGFMINWQFGLLAAGVVVIGVWALLAGKDRGTERNTMEDGDEIPLVESERPWLISDETVDDPGWSSLAGNVWHHD